MTKERDIREIKLPNDLFDRLETALPPDLRVALPDKFPPLTFWLPGGVCVVLEPES